MHANCFGSFWYLLAGQSVQLAAPEVAEYLPAAHSTHELAPAKDPVFVSEPAPQSLHATVEACEYFPASHLAHAVAPVADSVSVTEPAAHSAQYDFALSP